MYGYTIHTIYFIKGPDREMLSSSPEAAPGTPDRREGVPRREGEDESSSLSGP